jgi:hypothetical protein
MQTAAQLINGMLDAVKDIVTMTLSSASATYPNAGSLMMATFEPLTPQAMAPAPENDLLQSQRRLMQAGPVPGEPTDVPWDTEEEDYYGEYDDVYDDDDAWMWAADDDVDGMAAPVDRDLVTWVVSLVAPRAGEAAPPPMMQLMADPSW